MGENKFRRYKDEHRKCIAVVKMEDIKLLETCPYCGEHITLMESVNTENQKLYLVKRCLGCQQYPVVEVVKLAEDYKVK